MSLDPRLALGRWRAAEGAVEIGLPMLAAALAWVGASRVLSAPTAARPLTNLELYALFGAAAALTGWMAGRQLWIAGRKGPWGQVGLAVLYTGLALLILPGVAADGFAEACAEMPGGEIVLTAAVAGGDGAVACRRGGVPDNPYLPGALLRPSWGGETGWLWAVGLGSTILGVLALRDRRIQATKMARRLFALLQYAPAAGLRAAARPPPVKDGRLVACANPTLWGEICGQLYSADRVFAPGESCERCGAAFRRAEREISFKVVSLFTADIDVLNGLEKTDTVSWRRDEPMTPDARVSGVERWVTLGTVTLPDVVTVATALGVVHELLPSWAGTERVAAASALASAKASRVSAWLWFGSLSHRLTYARPGVNVALAIGPTRLRDLVPEGGEELWLQLDLGLLPVELRYGFRKSTAGGERPPELQNSKSDLWVPVAPAEMPKDRPGLWIPRVEGEALRAWLSTERLREDADSGVSIPLPYLAWLGSSVGEPPPDPFATRPPRPGSLDLVRMPLDRDGAQPTGERTLGDSIAEWDWLEWEQILLLRRQCLVLVSREAAGGGA